MKKRRQNENRTTRFFIYTIIALVFINLGLYSFYRFLNPLALKSSTYEVQVNSKFDPRGNISYVFLGDPEDVLVSGDMDINDVGDYYMVYTYNGKPYNFTLSIVDRESPILECTDYTTDLVEDVTESSFVVRAKDDSPFTLKMESDDDLSSEGSHIINITATDQYGNATTRQVTLVRQEDTEAPVLEGFEEKLELGTNENFSTASYEVKDNLDDSPTLHVDSSTLDLETPGTYQVIYTVRDRSGNENTYTQEITVVEKRIAYLTFDDGPSSENTQDVLDVLDRYGVKATFFVTGQDPDSFDLMKKASEAGHTIALHTLTHDYATLYSSPEAYFEDLNAIKQIVKDETGIEADCIRFPGGSSNTVSANYNIGIMSYLTEAVHEAGYEYFDWNVSSGDAAGTNVPASDIIANVTSSIGEPYAVMLFHDTFGKTTTVEALPAIIEAYRDAGYEFAALTKDSFPAHHGVNN